MRLVVITRSWRRHDQPALAAAGPAPLVALDTEDGHLPARSAAWRALSRHELGEKLLAQGVETLDAARLDESALAQLARLGVREIHLDAASDPLGEAWCRRLASVGLPLVRHSPALSVLEPLLEGRAGLPRSFTAFHRLFEARSQVQQGADFTGGSTACSLPPQLREHLRWRGQAPHPNTLPNGWRPGEDSAQDMLQRFLDRPWSPDANDWARSAASAFAEGGSSGLSPWLAQGDLGPRRLWEALGEAARDPLRAPLAHSLRRQLVWRDYALALHAHHPELEWQPVAATWRNFPTRPDARRLRAWREGCTGIPLVDAAMRQLQVEGWMHNRLRMLCGTWLVKQMGQPWQDGLAHFRDMLVDWDPALNAMNWQWCAGCGVDAQPWFRLFSPEKQAEKADPDGALLRRWVPELSALSLPLARRAWSLTPLERAGLDYATADPDPVRGRAEALAAWAAFRA